MKSFSESTGPKENYRICNAKRYNVSIRCATKKIIVKIWNPSAGQDPHCAGAVIEILWKQINLWRRLRFVGIRIVFNKTMFEYDVLSASEVVRIVASVDVADSSMRRRKIYRLSRRT